MFKSDQEDFVKSSLKEDSVMKSDIAKNDRKWANFRDKTFPEAIESLKEKLGPEILMQVNKASAIVVTEDTIQEILEKERASNIQALVSENDSKMKDFI